MIKSQAYRIKWSVYIKYCYLLADLLRKKIQKSGFSISHNTIIVTAPRGGYIPSSIIAYKLGIDKIFSCGYSSYKDKQRKEGKIYQELPFLVMEANIVILIDDIIDTSQTIIDIKNIIKKNTTVPNVYTAAVFVKEKSRANADCFTKVIPNNKWVEFPYDY